MVLDSKLPEHLAHFGINMMTMEKVRSVFLLFLVEADFLFLSLIIANIKSVQIHFSTGLLCSTSDDILVDRSIAQPSSL